MKKRILFSFAITALMLTFNSCSKEEEETNGPGNGRYSNYLSSMVVVPPEELNLNSFYKKYLNTTGIPIISSELCSDQALYRADSIFRFLLVGQEAALNDMISTGLYLGIIGDGEATADFPEYAFLATATDRNWDTEPIGRYEWPYPNLAVVSEANLMCLPSDLYGGTEDLTIHEFFHTVDVALRNVSSSYRSEVMAAYNNAIANGLWANTYAASNNYEYLAEGVQSYYNVNAEGPVGGNGIHNEINTRAELQSYDPQLYKLISTKFNPSLDLPVCNPTQ